MQQIEGMSLEELQKEEDYLTEWFNVVLSEEGKNKLNRLLEVELKLEEESNK
jgi:hypothetical protein